MIFALLFVVALTLLIIKMVIDHQMAKEKEAIQRLKNELLVKYWNEAHNDNNDGWTKQHYLDLYYLTKAELEVENKKSL